MFRLVTIALCAVACGDNLAPGPWILDPVAARDGLWIRTPEFEVASGTEIQNCYFFAVPDLDGSRQELWIDHAILALNPGSHHMNVFRVKTIRKLDPALGSPVDLGGVQGTAIYGADDAECWKSGNWSDWPLVANSQQSSLEQQQLDWRLPDGVAMRLTPGETLMLQVHYVNATDQSTPWVGRGGVNLYRSRNPNPIELGTLFATNQNIRVCRSSPEPSFDRACSLPPGPHTIVAANGHFHSRGARFQIWTWDSTSSTAPGDGARFYDSANWAEPVMATGLDIAMSDPGGVWWRCNYQWHEPAEGCAAVDARDPLGANDCCYTFGPIVETSEHCNVFMYYYPIDRGPITCL